jgi:hypothetical protein
MIGMFFGAIYISFTFIFIGILTISRQKISLIGAICQFARQIKGPESRTAPGGQGPHPHDIFIGADLVLGREDFKTRIEQMTQRQTRPGRVGRPAHRWCGESRGGLLRFVRRANIREFCALTPVFVFSSGWLMGGPFNSNL